MIPGRKRFKKRRISFTVTAVRDNRGNKQWTAVCKRCKERIPAVSSMTGHANMHFTNLDMEDFTNSLQRAAIEALHDNKEQ